MADQSRVTLTPEQLEELLTKLDDVLAEAGRLRAEVERQMREQHDSQQQRVTPGQKRPATKPRKRR